MQESNNFIDYLAKLQSIATDERKDSHSSYNQASARAALAKLRRGLSQPPGTVYEMYPYIVPFLPTEASKAREDVYFLIGALFAYHPEKGGSGNMGSHFASTRDPDSDNTAIERRFAALLAAHVDDLPVHLRQAIGFLRSRQPAIPVNWHRLFSDLLNWTHPSGYVQKEWARAFWGRTNPSAQLAEQMHSVNEATNTLINQSANQPVTN